MDDALLDAARQAELAIRIQAGDRDAEDELHRWARPRVFAMLLARTRDRETSHDLCQDVMIAVLQALRAGQLRDPHKLAAFIQGIARNIANNYLRSKSAEPPHQPISELAAEPAVAEIEDLRHEAFVHEALRTLAPQDRQILSMAFVEGLKPGKIADRLGLTAEAARQRKSRALKRIEEYIRTVTKRPR